MKCTTVHRLRPSGSHQKRGPGIGLLSARTTVMGSLPGRRKISSRGFEKNTGPGLFLFRVILDITGITIRETGVLTKVHDLR